MSGGTTEHPEARARRQIDAMLTASGWDVQDRKDMNLAAAPGVAIREFQTSGGPADYLLFLGNQLVGVIEAKKAGVTLSSVEAQTRDYAAKAPKPLQVPVRPLPFLYESTGIETWFTNGLAPEARARRLFSFHQPGTLSAWLDAELDRSTGILRVESRKEASVGLMLTRDDCTTVRVVVQDPATDAVLAESAELPVKLGI